MTTADGVTVVAYDFGGDGPDLLLAHATGFHARVWLPVVEHLQAEFRCVAFDERGHGDSGSPPGGDFAWKGFALDALAVVDGMGLDHPYGVGHSCGGAALLMAEEDRPGTFGALYCHEPVVLPVDPPPDRQPSNPMSEQARRRRDAFPSRQAAFEHYASKPPFAALDPAVLRAYVEYGFDDVGDGTARLKCRPEDEAAVYAANFAHHTYVRLAAVRCPVTLACGSDTDAFGVPLLEALAARLPASRIEPLPGLGHFGPLQDPGAVAAAIHRAFQPAGRHSRGV